MPHPAMSPNHVAVVTGGASGIGLAAAQPFAAMGLRSLHRRPRRRPAFPSGRSRAVSPGPDGPAGVMAGADGREPRRGRSALGSGGSRTVRRHRSPDEQRRRAARQRRCSARPQSLGPGDRRQPLGRHSRFPHLRARHDRPRAAGACIINTGSKQGITTPPGDPAYNVSKAGVKAFTEALQHELRNTPGCRITAHLLIPGFVFTPLTAKGRTAKPDGAWTPEQTVDFMMDRVAAGDFYILVPGQRRVPAG